MAEDRDDDKLFRLITFGVIGGMLLTIGALLSYVVYFGFYLRTGLSGDPAAWGAFGDYLGGMLNPSVAFFAFLLLAKSVQIQHRELRETSEALKRASEAQGEQVAVQMAAATMNALSALLASVEQQISTLSAARFALLTTPDDRSVFATMRTTARNARVAELEAELNELQALRVAYTEALNEERYKMRPPTALETALRTFEG